MIYKMLSSRPPVVPPHSAVSDARQTRRVGREKKLPAAAVLSNSVSGPRSFVVMFDPKVGSSLPGLATQASGAPDPRGRASVEHDQSMTTISGQ